MSRIGPPSPVNRLRCRSWGLKNDALDNFDYHFTSRYSYPMTVRVDVNTNMKGDNEIDGDGGVTKHKQANFSTMTDSSNMSKLMLNDRSTSSRGHSAEKLSKVEVNCGDSGSTITVKVTCK
ncbi:hypothetical protein KY290_032022 [Solanum tuberosum]|uniref:Uncharacterized protein n=1 Tax=Solanum tuberosum TaxID=4113 RepID=A0ABQ7UBJ7_SOLTU|nr:hypothetical protein KY290_032022 [Solanum tuberosum]